MFFSLVMALLKAIANFRSVQYKMLALSTCKQTNKQKKKDKNQHTEAKKLRNKTIIKLM